MPWKREIERVNRMREKLILALIREIYNGFIRELLIDAVHRTDNEWDDNLIALLDAILGDGRIPIQKGT